MTPQEHRPFPTEGAKREELASFFLSAPPLEEQTPAQRREYLNKLKQLGQLECRDILRNAGCARPLVWGNPAPLIQALLCAAQRLGARLGQPLFLFPAHSTAIGKGTLFHPRVLAAVTAAVVRDACKTAPRQPVWVRLHEQSGGLVVAVTANGVFPDTETLALIKECTRLHDGSLVHSENTVIFTCGPACDPPANVRLYGCPTEEELLQDTLSPVWSVFYAGIYSALVSSEESVPSSSGERSIRSATTYASEEANSAAASASTEEGTDS